jgi:hypothetical protein
MIKNVSVSGPDGTINGMVSVRKRQVVKQFKNAATLKNESRKVTVFDVESFVNGQPFGEVSKGLSDAAIAEIEAKRHESLLMDHLNKMARKNDSESLESTLQEMGFVDEQDVLANKKQVLEEKKQEVEEHLDAVSSWIKAHTKRVGLGVVHSLHTLASV